MCGGKGFNLYGVEGGAAGTSVVMNGCYGNANGEAGFYFGTMVYCVLNGCAADSNAVGYVLERCQGVTLSSCGAESTVATGSHMLNDGTNFRVDGCDGIHMDTCWTYANSAVGVHVSGGSRRIRVSRFGENSPLATAAATILVDSESQLE